MSLNLLVSTFRKKKSSFLYNPDEWKRFKGHGQQQVEILWFISRVISSFFLWGKESFLKFSSRRHLRVLTSSSTTLTRDNTQTSLLLSILYRKAYFDEGDGGYSISFQ